MSALPFIDLAAQRRRLGDRIERAINRVLDHGIFIMGPEVEALERQLAEYCGVRHAVTCANGRDALALVRAPTGLALATPCSFPRLPSVASAEVIPPTGATPMFVYVLPEIIISTRPAWSGELPEARRLGLRPRMVVPVDLFGQPADYGTSVR